MAKPLVHDIVMGLLRAHGVECTLEKTSRHNKVLFVLDGRRQMYTCSRTPSDGRTLLNAKADIKRMLRQAGVLPS
jgi:hypothetical protein